MHHLEERLICIVHYGLILATQFLILTYVSMHVKNQTKWNLLLRVSTFYAKDIFQPKMNWAIWPHLFLWMFRDENAKSCTKLSRLIPSWITGLKLAMNTHYNCGSDMGWVSPGYIPFSGSVMLVMVYIYVCIITVCMFV